MPHNTEFTNKLETIQDLFPKNTDSQDIKASMIDINKKFMTKTIIKKLDSNKSNGYSGSLLFSVLLFLPYFSVFSIWDLVSSNMKQISESGKDAYYEFKNNSKINWRDSMYLFVKRFIFLTNKNCNNLESSGTKCLIVDDTTFPKTGKTIEGISYVWDHVFHKSILGFKSLFLGYYDGYCFIPLDFSLHNEIGKKKLKPFGLTKKQLKKQTKKNRNADSPTKQRVDETRIDKITNSINMIKYSIKKKIIADYVLADSWFICEKFIKEIRNIKNGIIHVIGTWKLTKHKICYNGKEYNPNQLRVLLKRKKSKRSRKIRAQYIEIIVIFKDIKLKLFYVNYNGTNKWNILVTTDLSLSFNKTIEIYNIRWTIEVFFKEAKQYLRIGKDQSENFNSQIADTTIKAIQYIMLSFHKRVNDFKTIGALFKHSKIIMSELTLYEKLWKIFTDLINIIIVLFNIDIDEVIKKIMCDNDYEYKILKILRSINNNNKLQAA